jgi:hypothetical protein
MKALIVLTTTAAVAAVTVVQVALHLLKDVLVDLTTANTVVRTNRNAD